MSKIDNERVSVQLKTLVDMAPEAGKIKFNRSPIRSMQSGGYLSRFKGRGMEFDEARLYQPGDDIRCIDWRVTARTGKAHTKIFREERERPIFISVDYRQSMAFATRGVFKSVQAAKVAALIAWAAQHQGDRIGGQIFSDHGCLELKPQNGKHAVLRLFNALVTPAYTYNADISLQQAMSRLVQHARPGSRVYVISDFRGLDDFTEMHLSRLSKHCEVILVQVFDELESHLPESGRYRFTDEIHDVIIDSGDKQKLLDYQRRFHKHCTHLQQLSQKLGLNLLQCPTSQPPAQLFMVPASASKH